MGARPSPDGRGRAGFLGNVRLPHVRGPMARATIPGRLTWRSAQVTQRVPETPRVTTLVLAVPGWPGHLAGQHVDVRLTADDGYQAHRSYSIASPPDDADQLALTIERIEDGEVSPYLVDTMKRVTNSTCGAPSAAISRGMFRWAVRC